jgi:nitrite reductase/ring-hydroxylating ferredoxin subunit
MFVNTGNYCWKFLSGWIFFFLMAGCGKDEKQATDEIPVVGVFISINPNSTEYNRLNTVSGWEYLTGGYRGILVYRMSPDEFVAFERACPYDWKNSTARIVVDSSAATVTCPSCKSEFSILDGIPLKGPSKYPLKKYQTSYDGTNLVVTN